MQELYFLVDDALTHDASIIAVSYLFINQCDGIKTYAFMGPVHSILNLNRWLDRDFMNDIIQRLKNGFTGRPVSIC